MHRYSRPDANVDAIVKQVMAEEAAERKAAFHLRLRGKGVQDLAVLRAFERVDREAFVPHRYLDLAARDIALPIGCGQTMDEPWVMARMIEALRVSPEHRVLEIGTGSGYATAVLAQMAHEVLSVERFQTLAAAAQDRLMSLGIANALVVHGDGFDLPPELAPFDRLLVNGRLTQIPEGLLRCLAPGGLLVCVHSAPASDDIIRIATGVHANEERICPCRLDALLPGLASAL